MRKGLVLSDCEYRAKLLNEATAGAGTNENTLIDVLCRFVVFLFLWLIISLFSARSPQLVQTKDAFKSIYKDDLEKVIKRETSFAFEKLLVEILKCARPEWGVDQAVMKSGSSCSSFLYLFCQIFSRYRSSLESNRRKVGNR